MNKDTARLLKKYAKQTIPAVALLRFPWMPDALYRLLKQRYPSMSHTDKAALRQCAKRNLPLPEDIKQEARQRGIIVEWPPRQGG